MKFHLSASLMTKICVAFNDGGNAARVLYDATRGLPFAPCLDACGKIAKAVERLDFAWIGDGYVVNV